MRVSAPSSGQSVSGPVSNDADTVQIIILRLALAVTVRAFRNIFIGNIGDIPETQKENLYAALHFTGALKSVYLMFVRRKNDNDVMMFSFKQNPY